MASLTVRINDDAHAKLKAICEESGRSMPEILDRAIELLRRERLLEATNRAFAALRDDPKAWAAEQRERREWDATLGDGVEGDDHGDK
ncbi:MAG: ribbon-helix-helix protein, CopG family [Planctomycetales bacterium]|nr:ribbon-helix-helix protein, CopG family [Planctomycetales bacterium]